MDIRVGIVFLFLIGSMSVSCKLVSWRPRQQLSENNATIESSNTSQVTKGVDMNDAKGFYNGLLDKKPKPNGLNKTYHIQDFKGNWYKALHYCIVKGMYMATVLSKAENDNLIEQIKNATEEKKYGKDDHFWLGGTRMGQLHYYWLGYSDSMDFTDWKKEEPVEPEKPCIELRTYERWYGTYYKWSNQDCHVLNYVVCEKH